MVAWEVVGDLHDPCRPRHVFSFLFHRIHQMTLSEILRIPFNLQSSTLLYATLWPQHSSVEGGGQGAELSWVERAQPLIITDSKQPVL